jgi:hypothetical protein
MAAIHGPHDPAKALRCTETDAEHYERVHDLMQGVGRLLQRPLACSSVEYDDAGGPLCIARAPNTVRGFIAQGSLLAGPRRREEPRCLRYSVAAEQCPLWAVCLPP